MDKTPNDTIIDIIAYLDIRSYLQLRQTCRRFCNLDISRLIQKEYGVLEINYVFLNVLHRNNDLPATIYDDGTRFWYLYGKRHRDGDEPAIIYADGSLEWYRNGKCHRDNDLPAEIYASGTRKWYQHGKLHRGDNKPAVIYVGGVRKWYTDDTYIKGDIAFFYRYIKIDFLDMKNIR